MDLPRREFLCRVGTAVASLAVPQAAWADAYPSRPVRVIVPFAPGGVDVVGRLIAQRLSEQMGQQFFVENVGGAGSSIGTARAARSAPDGYTILFTASALVITPALQRNVAYDPEKDFAPVTCPAAASLVLLVNPSVPAHALSDLAALIKSSPGKYNFSSAGVGTSPHLTGELFRQSLGRDLVHVPYNSGGEAIGSVLAGHTHMCFAAAAPAVAQIEGGKLRALAVASRRRLPALPNVPTTAEAGYPDIEGEVWCAFLGPVGTPSEIVTELHRQITRIVRQPDVTERLTALGYTAVGSSPDELAQYIRAERAKWARVVRDAGLRAE
jgi:tripartite-type tricarboxylate transporter receptor subunit TctC